MPEAIFGGLLEIRVDGELHAAAFLRGALIDQLDLPANAVDDDVLVAIGSHEQSVERLLDSGVSDNRPGLDPLILGVLQLRLGHLAHVSEQMRRHVRRWILPSRDVLKDDPGQLGLARAHGHDLLTRRIVDEDDGPVTRLQAPAVDRLAHDRFVGTCRLRQHVQRLLEILGLLPDESDGVGVVILDKDLSMAIEQHTPGRRQRQLPHVVLFRHLPEFLVLRDLEHPERDRQRGEQDGDDVLQRRQPHRKAAAIVGHHCVGHKSPASGFQLPASGFFPDFEIAATSSDELAGSWKPEASPAPS
jgi:hypothetical protein